MLKISRPRIATAAELEGLELERARPAAAPQLNMGGEIGEAVDAEISAEREARIRFLREKLGAERIRARSAFDERSYER